MSEKVIKEVARLVKEREDLRITVLQTVQVPGNPTFFYLRCRGQMLFTGYNTRVNRGAVCQMIEGILSEIEVEEK